MQGFHDVMDEVGFKDFGYVRGQIYLGKTLPRWPSHLGTVGQGFGHWRLDWNVSQFQSRQSGMCYVWSQTNTYLTIRDHTKAKQAMEIWAYVALGSWMPWNCTGCMGGQTSKACVESSRGKKIKTCQRDLKWWSTSTKFFNNISRTLKEKKIPAQACRGNCTKGLFFWPCVRP